MLYKALFGVIFLKKLDFSNASDTKGGVSRVKSTFAAVGAAYLISLVLLLILALIVTYTSFNEDWANTAVGIIGGIAALVTGIFAAKNAQSRGYLHGGIAAVIYRLLLTCVGDLIYTGADFGMKFFLSLLLAFILGAVGGIIGINMGK